MSAADGVVIGATKIRDRGADSLNWNLVIVAEGYTAAEQTAFETAADAFVTALFAIPPFDVELTSEINVYRLDVHSDESGADNPAVCADGSTPFAGLVTTAATYFDAEFCATGLRRLCTVDTTLVETTVNTHVPEWDVAVVIVNHFEYGGAGWPNVAVYSLTGGTEMGIHELGHAAFDLADEYDYYLGCASGETTQDNFIGPDDEPNITTNTNLATLKWAGYVDAATPVPTTVNADCTECDPQVSPVAPGTVGLFEGAGYYHCGLYRPEFDCRMNHSTQPFCAVCQDQIVGSVRQSVWCFVAGAVYGDPRHPDVETLRRWRNRHLRPGAPGRMAMAVFTEFYQTVGPPLARWVGRRPRIARLLRNHVLAPFAAWLRGRH